MNAFSYRLTEWFECILKNAGGDPFVCVGSFPDRLACLFRAVGMPFEHVATPVDLDEHYAGYVWNLIGLSLKEMMEEVPGLVQKYRPRRIYLELLPGVERDQRRVIESLYFALGYRRHPRQLFLVALGPFYLFERMTEGLPFPPHPDPLCQAESEAETELARYHWAAQHIRPHDIVVDAGCGVGAGAYIIAHNSQCGRVLATSGDEAALSYARASFSGTGKVLEFQLRPARALLPLDIGPVQAIVAFGGLESNSDKVAFLNQCLRALMPGGRLLCALPLDENELLEPLRAGFLIEHREGRLVVAMKDPATADPPAFRAHNFPQLEIAHTNNAAFGRDYANPWLVHTCVTPGGTRTRSADLLRQLTERERLTAPAGSADRGAALCVRGYQLLELADIHSIRSLLPAINDYLRQKTENAHQFRWKVSLQFLSGKIHLLLGNNEAACEAFLNCSREDCLCFGPTLGTKTVEACFLHGWLLHTGGRTEEAVISWQRGVREAERILKEGDWREIRGRDDLPFDWGLSEVTLLLNTAQRCAFAVYAVRSGIFEREQLDFEILCNGERRNPINRGQIRFLSERSAYFENENQALRDSIKHLQHKLDQTHDQSSDIDLLRRELDKKNRIIEKLRKQTPVI